MNRISIDEKMLERLWNGELRIAEECYPETKEYWEAVKKLDSIHQQLIQVCGIRSNSEDILEQYEMQSSVIMELEKREAFKKGVEVVISIIAGIIWNNQ